MELKITTADCHYHHNLFERLGQRNYIKSSVDRSKPKPKGSINSLAQPGATARSFVEIHVEPQRKVNPSRKISDLPDRTQLPRYNSPNSGRNKMMGLVTIRVALCCKSANDAETHCTNRWFASRAGAAPEARRRRELLRTSRAIGDRARTGHSPQIDRLNPWTRRTHFASCPPRRAMSPTFGR